MDLAVTPFCLGVIVGAFLIAAVVATGSWVACELMDGRADVGF